jgi:hypothetical protein
VERRRLRHEELNQREERGVGCHQHVPLHEQCIHDVAGVDAVFGRRQNLACEAIAELREEPSLGRDTHAREEICGLELKQQCTKHVPDHHRGGDVGSQDRRQRLHAQGASLSAHVVVGHQREPRAMIVFEPVRQRAACIQASAWIADGSGLQRAQDCFQRGVGRRCDALRFVEQDHQETMPTRGAVLNRRRRSRWSRRSGPSNEQRDRTRERSIAVGCVLSSVHGDGRAPGGLLVSDATPLASGPPPR